MEKQKLQPFCLFKYSLELVSLVGEIFGLFLNIGSIFSIRFSLNLNIHRGWVDSNLINLHWMCKLRDLIKLINEHNRKPIESGKK